MTTRHRTSAALPAPGHPQTLATGSDHYIQVRQPDLVITAHGLVAQRAATSR
jgi:hypothetical protein